MIDLSYHNWAKLNYISSNSNRGKSFYTVSKKVNSHDDSVMTFTNYSNGIAKIRVTCILPKTDIKNNASEFTLSPLEQFCTSRNGRKWPAFLLPIIECERLRNERMISESGKIPCRIPISSLCITEVNNEDAQYGTLMDVLTHSEVATKFKCVVRVVAASPYSAEDLWSPDGTYRMRLTLEDPTARIHALVVAKDGVTL
ncbi:hypothetical protein SESBI_37696 [Sesbania bispinosa]|nr:hypothetical protein SESBI_37696 [Sesbania bispinosa]